MKKVYLLLCLLLLIMNFWSCTNDEDKVKDEDRVKMVEMTIYPETGYTQPVLRPVWIDVLVYSESDDIQIRALSNTITEGFDFEYERGYQYTFKAQKVWMNNPPMDVSSIKYIFAGSLEKQRVIVENSEVNMELFVSSETVEYIPNFPIENDNEGKPKIYDALFCLETNTNNWYVLKEIEGFDFESGHEYILSVKKITHANPFSLQFVLIDIKDKQKK